MGLTGDGQAVWGTGTREDRNRQGPFSVLLASLRSVCAGVSVLTLEFAGSKHRLTRKPGLHWGLSARVAPG